MLVITKLWTWLQAHGRASDLALVVQVAINSIINPDLVSDGTVDFWVCVTVYMCKCYCHKWAWIVIIHSVSICTEIKRENRVTACKSLTHFTQWHQQWCTNKMHHFDKAWSCQLVVLWLWFEEHCSLYWCSSVCVYQYYPTCWQSYYKLLNFICLLVLFVNRTYHFALNNTNLT